MPVPNWCLPDLKAVVGTGLALPAAARSGPRPKDKMIPGIDCAFLLSSSQIRRETVAIAGLRQKAKWSHLIPTENRQKTGVCKCLLVLSDP